MSKPEGVKKERTAAQIAAQQRAMAVMRERNAARNAAKAAGLPTPQQPKPTKDERPKSAVVAESPAYTLPGHKSKVVAKGGKQVQAGLRPEPRPQRCTVCGYERKFTGYLTKKGKDGRIAKWPGFEDCPNLNDPKLHPHKARAADVRILQDFGHMTGNTSASMFEFTGASGKDNRSLRALPERKPSPPATLFNLEDHSIADSWPTIVDYTKQRLGAAPLYLYVHPDELAVRLAEKKLPAGVEIKPRRNVMHQHVVASVQAQRDLPALQVKSNE